MNSKTLRWVSFALLLALFGIVSLIASLATPATPGSNRGAALIVPIFAGMVVVITFPYLFNFFERQQNKIERQHREIEILHAMDEPIIAEMELPHLLEYAVRRTLRALDADAGGIVLRDPVTGASTDEAFSAPGRDGDDLDAFREIVRTGGRPSTRWEAVVLPLQGTGEEQELGWIAAARYRPCLPFTPAAPGALAALATTIEAAVSSARARQAARQTERIAADLERERRVARAWSEALLPEIPAQAGQWHFSKRYAAQSDEALVGGDIYDLFRLDQKRWGVVIADVSGKGLAAAKKNCDGQVLLRSYAREHASPALVLNRLNDALFDEPDLTGFVTLVYGVLSEEGSQFIYASAGHEPPLLRRADGKFELLEPTGMVVGVMRGQEYDDVVVNFLPGDGLLLYTDGLSEARSPEARADDSVLVGKQSEIPLLSVEGVRELLARLRGCPPHALADAVLDLVLKYTGDNLTDDAALLWIERAVNAPKTS